ncbi:MAG TPA: hypothetical protein PLZ55_17220, partial [bacterium]|nr:hypothetical protein [bacterium]
MHRSFREGTVGEPDVGGESPYSVFDLYHAGAPEKPFFAVTAVPGSAPVTQSNVFQSTLIIVRVVVAYETTAYTILNKRGECAFVFALHADLFVLVT